MKAISFLKANGKEKTLAEANNPKGQFIKGEVYVVVMDLNATMLAHPINQKIIGMNVIDLPDTDGKMFRREIIETAKTKGEGWVDYKYKNPTSNKVESKTSFIKRADNMIFVCGTYK
jgi:signal transduction histidine kinase